MDRAKFLDKVSEGLVVGLMVALVVTVTGVVWNEFSDATEQLRAAKDILDTQGQSNGDQALFNEKQLETNERMLAAFERLEKGLAELEGNAVTRYGSQAARDSFEMGIGLVGGDLGRIRQDLSEYQSEQEQLQRQLIQRQEQQQMQQKKW